MCKKSNTSGVYMGRGNYPNRSPRSSLIANREIRAALRESTPPSFGVRRPLEENLENSIVDTLFALQEQSDIPENVLLRTNLAVTLLSQKTISRQLMRGVLVGYNLGRTSAQINRSSDCANRTEPLKVKRGDIRVYNSRIIYAQIESDELCAEIEAIHRILGAAGIHGMARKEKLYVPHMTLGQTEKGEHISGTEIRHVEHVVDELIPQDLELESWDIYPHNVLAQVDRH